MKRHAQEGGKNLRARASLRIDDDVIIDFGPDIYGHTLHRGLDLSSLRTIVMTHAHSDHFAVGDMNRIFAQYAMDRGDKVIDLIANRSVLDRMDVAKNQLGTRYVLHEAVPGQSVQIADGTVHLLAARHDPGQICVLPVIERGGRAVLYATDTAVFTEEMWAEVSLQIHLDLVIFDCTKVDMGLPSAVFTPEDPSVFGGHMGLEENLAMKDRLLALGLATARTQFVSTHFAHMFGPLHDRLTDAFAGTGLRPAYDGLVLEV